MTMGVGAGAGWSAEVACSGERHGDVSFSSRSRAEQGRIYGICVRDIGSSRNDNSSGSGIAKLTERGRGRAREDLIRLFR